MGMKRNNLTGPDQSVENAHCIVFKEQLVIGRGGLESVEVAGPFVCNLHGSDYSDGS